MKEIANKYFEGRCSESEMKELLIWLRNKDNKKAFREYKAEWGKTMCEKEAPFATIESWYHLQDKLSVKTYNLLQQTQKVNFVLKIAAVFFLVISTTGALYYFYTKPAGIPLIYTSVMADKGHISKAELPDGTLIWLNSGTTIRYNNYFGLKNRDLTLSGEAYLNVVENSNIPLNVNCGETKVQVLGTQFNVLSNEQTGNLEVVLEKGKVRLISQERQVYTVNPGEYVRFNIRDKKLTVDNVNTSRYTSWKEGIINIYNQPLEEVISRLELRYNQIFRVDPLVKDITFTFTIKNEPLDEILKLMQSIAPVKAVQKEDVIIFKPDDKKLKKTMG